MKRFFSELSVLMKKRKHLLFLIIPYEPNNINDPFPASRIDPPRETLSTVQKTSRPTPFGADDSSFIVIE